MHASSLEKVRAFRNAYLSERAEPIQVLDIGSGSRADGYSYRNLFPAPSFDYVGLDVEPGHNVDVVPMDPFSWSEVDTESVDVAVSGQAFEHTPYFWITAAEMSRVLRQGGFAVVIAPSKGRVHRFPLDCWRFYPDSWAALCAYVGLDLIETSTESTSWRTVIPGVYWGDALMIARKPALTDETTEKAYYDRLRAIVETRAVTPVPAPGPGRASRSYRSLHSESTPRTLSKLAYRMAQPLSPDLRQPRLLRSFRRRVMAASERDALRRSEAAMPWPPPRQHR
ncbi:MAG TPA: class I SAM-dependent methyltransferase [Acidimicrobiales bacterium]|nr:class I SAM-dependent methyltransferase [Acidimicrobiales bacterium]